MVSQYPLEQGTLTVRVASIENAQRSPVLAGPVQLPTSPLPLVLREARLQLFNGLLEAIAQSIDTDSDSLSHFGSGQPILIFEVNLVDGFALALHRRRKRRTVLPRAL